MPYSRAELLQAVRTDHPEFQGVDDNRLFAAIAVDHPDLAKGISELQPKAGESTTPQYPWYSRYFSNEGLGTAQKVVNAFNNTAPTAKTGFEPTGNRVLDFARGALQSGVAGPPEITTASPLSAIVKASPAGQMAIAAKGAAEGIGATVQNAFERITNPPREPIEAITKALKPIATNTQFASHVERALPEIKAAESDLGKPVESVSDMADAIKIAKKNIWDQYQQIASPQAARGVDASPVADAIEASIPTKLKIQNPQAAENIKKLAGTYRQTFTLGQLDDMLSTTNAELSGYYAKYPAAQRVAAASNPDLAQNVAEGTALRKLIYGQLDATGNAGAQDLKQTYGSLMNLEKETQRRLNVAARQNPDSLSEQLSRWQAAMKIGKAAVTFPTRPIGAAGDIASAYAGRTMATALKQANSSDALIANAFKNYQSPGSLSSRITPSAFTPAGLLQSGPIITPQAADTSYVRGVPAEYGALTGERQEIQSRLDQLRDIARSGATETTGKGLRAFNESTGEVGPVIGRGGGGYKIMFPELKNFTESPSQIAEALEKGRGALYMRIEYVVRRALADKALNEEDISFPFGENEVH